MSRQSVGHPGHAHQFSSTGISLADITWHRSMSLTVLDNDERHSDIFKFIFTTTRLSLQCSSIRHNLSSVAKYTSTPWWKFTPNQRRIQDLERGGSSLPLPFPSLPSPLPSPPLPSLPLPSHSLSLLLPLPFPPALVPSPSLPLPVPSPSLSLPSLLSS